MTERTITNGLMEALKLFYPKGLVIKHSDRFTAGIPDLSIAVDGPTTWFEVKYVRRGSSLRDEIKPIQLLMCRLLWRATKGRCWFIAYYESPREVRLVAPGAVALRHEGEPDPAFVAQGFDHGIVQKVIAA